MASSRSTDYLKRSAMVLALPLLVWSSGWALAPDKAFHQYIKDSWSIEEGLPQITVNAIVQGPRGYIWAATQSGVARFDGVRFTAFEPANTPEMPGLFAQALYVDSLERLWVGTYKGAAFYRDGRFHSVDDGTGRDIDVFEITESGEGEVVMATDHGLLRLSDGKLVAREDDPEGPLRAVFRHEDWLLAGGVGEIHVDRGDGWQRIVLPDELSSALVNAFTRHDDRFWAATTKGLLVHADGQWKQQVLPEMPDDEVIEILYSDRDENLWVGAAGQLLRFQGDRLVERVPDDAPFAHSSIRAIAEDHEGNLWLGSQWEGVARLWDSWVFRYDEPEGLHNSLVWSVARDGEGNIWTGTMDGLAVFRNGRFEQVTGGSEQPHPHAYTLLPEPDRVWVGTRTGLFWWNREHDTLEKPAAFDVLDASQVNGIIHRQDGSYWLATFDGIWRWDGERMERMAEPGEPGGRDVRFLLETRDNRLLVGMRRGLLEYDPESGRFEAVPGGPQDQDVTALYERADGGLIAGTLDERLWFEIDDEWYEFGTEHGLPTNSPFAFGVSDGVLWTGGIRGIYELPLDAVDEWVEGAIDQLPARMVMNERGDVSGAQKGYCCNGAGNAKGFMHEGEFWLPSRGGLVHLVPDRISRNAEPPNIVIDRIRVGGQWRSVMPGETPELESNQRDVAFGFAVLSYQDPGSVQVEYRLEGFDDHWQQLDEPIQRQMFYTNLPAGEFRLQVRASNNADVWSQDIAELQLAIQPRLWETAPFQAFLLFAVLMLIWLVFNYRLRSLQRQRKELERTVAERTEALRIANEHLRDYSSRMETASMTDPLTGLWNRRYLFNQLPADLAHFHRELARAADQGQSMLFALVDIDYFKTINDRYGHAAGDLILEQFAEVLRDQVRRGDYVVRWGGEEFLLVFRPMPSSESENVAARLIDAIHTHEFEAGKHGSLRLNCSIGLAEYPPYSELPGAMSWEDAVVLADKALYYVKQHGRNGWCLVRPTSRAEPSALLRRLEDRLETLLADDSVVAIYSSR